MKRNLAIAALGLLHFGRFGLGDAQAAYKSLQRDGSANLVANAKVLVAPSRADLTLQIKRIRITTSASATSPSYRFFANNSAKKEGETESLVSCALPGCFELLAAESAKKGGGTFDYDDLNITLQPGDRLYFYASADISSESEFATIEVWYEERPEGGGSARGARRR